MRLVMNTPIVILTDMLEAEYGQLGRCGPRTYRQFLIRTHCVVKLVAADPIQPHTGLLRSLEKKKKPATLTSMHVRQLYVALSEGTLRLQVCSESYLDADLTKSLQEKTSAVQLMENAICQKEERKAIPENHKNDIDSDIPYQDESSIGCKTLEIEVKIERFAAEADIEGLIGLQFFVLKAMKQLEKDRKVIGMRRSI